LISQDVPPLGGVKQGCGGENKLFSSQNASISGKLWGIRPKLLLMTNRKLHYALSIDTNIDDLG